MNGAAPLPLAVPFFAAAQKNGVDRHGLCSGGHHTMARNGVDKRKLVFSITWW